MGQAPGDQAADGRCPQADGLPVEAHGQHELDRGDGQCRARHHHKCGWERSPVGGGHGQAQRGGRNGEQHQNGGLHRTRREKDDDELAPVPGERPLPQCRHQLSHPFLGVRGNDARGQQCRHNRHEDSDDLEELIEREGGVVCLGGARDPGGHAHTAPDQAQGGRARSQEPVVPATQFAQLEDHGCPRMPNP